MLTEHAFGEFYQRHSRAVWTYVYRVTNDAADADDIVQEAFLRLFQAGIEASDDEGLRRYVFRIAGNLIADRWRRRVRDAREAQAPVESDSRRDSMSSESSRSSSRVNERCCGSHTSRVTRTPASPSRCASRGQRESAVVASARTAARSADGAGSSRGWRNDG